MKPRFTRPQVQRATFAGKDDFFSDRTGSGGTPPSGFECGFKRNLVEARSWENQTSLMLSPLVAICG